MSTNTNATTTTTTTNNNNHNHHNINNTSGSALGDVDPPCDILQLLRHEDLGCGQMGRH